ncbi:MAG: SoxR reducing system RseC family protein [Elusimicrobia bacterium]|nr:SoxR reducing system RseC family protein [Elusimicrobiota bacterium]
MLMKVSGETRSVRAEVVKICGGFMYLRLEAPPECGDCGRCRTGESKTVSLPHKEGVSTGDILLLDVPCSDIIKISVLLYLVPSLCALAGFIGGYLVLEEPGGLAGSVLSLAACYLVIRLISEGRYKGGITVRGNQEHD